MIRPATLADLETVLGIAEAEAAIRYPRLKSDTGKMRKVLIQIISSAKHFCWVSVTRDDAVTGAIVAITNENLWAQRQSSNVIMWVSDIPGDGMKLLRALRGWITDRRAVKVVGFAPDTNDVDPRVWNLAERLGFKRYGGAYLFYN